MAAMFFPFMDEPETLILPQITKKPRLASWGCSDGSLNQLPHNDIRYNLNPSLASLIPTFSQEHQTLISPQITKKPRLASWGCDDGSFDKFSDICYNPKQSLASSIPPFFLEHGTLISQQNRKKPRLEAPWWSVDKSLDQLSVIFNKPPPITLNSTAGVSQPPPITLNSTAGVLKPPPITLNSTAGVSKPTPEVIVIDDDEIEEEINNTPLISPLSSVVSRPHPDLIAIDEDELIEDEIPELSDFKFDISPPIASPSFVVSKAPPEEEEMVAMSNDNTPKLESKDLRSVMIDREENKKKGDHGGFGHVTLDDLGVTVEDLKRIPWEAFDPSLGIKSVMLDPSFGWICSTDY